MGKKGVVREAQTHREVAEKVIDFADMIGFTVLDMEFSPVRGPEGNIEYLLYLEKDVERAGCREIPTEQEALECLRLLTEERTGLSHTLRWETKIRETVEKAQESL